MSTSRFETSLRFVLKWEGDRFTNDPDDRGGATRFGIIQREYDSYRRRRGLPARSVEFITRDEVREIYQHEYWQAVQGNRLPTPLDIVMFDTGVLMGVGRAIRFLQQSLGVTVNGIIGSETLNALSGADSSAIADEFLSRREAFLHRIVERNPSQEKFLRGWLNRLNDLRRTIKQHDTLNLTAEENGGESLIPEEGSAAGRAIIDLPDEFTGNSSEENITENFLMKKMGPATFLEATASMPQLSKNSLYILDISFLNRNVLRATFDASKPNWFEIPVAIVESVTPLSFSNNNPAYVSAMVLFRPEFQSLELTFRRLSDTLSDAADDTNPVAKAHFRQTFDNESYDLAGEDMITSDVTELDDDPASPLPGELETSQPSDLVTGIALANYGAEQGKAGFDVEQGAQEFALRSTARTLPIDIGAARNFLSSCMNSSPRVRYGLGAKIRPHGARPGRDFTKVDCSGFVREAIWRSTSPHFNFPDGSVVQHDWIRNQGFERCNRSDALLQDGIVRIAFLRPQDSPNGIGHVVLVYNARTLESHGGVGPNSRAWTNAGWQSKAFVYILSN